MPRVSTASYALQNANYNVMALLDSSGAVLERYEYSPYGQRTVYFSPGSNDPLAMAPTLRSRRLTVAGVDQPYGRNDFGHQGLMHEHPDDLVYNRARTLHTRLALFVQRDPFYANLPGGGYQDGLNLYQYEGQRDIIANDPEGTKFAQGIRVDFSAAQYYGVGASTKVTAAYRVEDCCDNTGRFFPLGREVFSVDVTAETGFGIGCQIEVAGGIWGSGVWGGVLKGPQYRESLNGSYTTICGKPSQGCFRLCASKGVKLGVSGSGGVAIFKLWFDVEFNVDFELCYVFPTAGCPRSGLALGVCRSGKAAGGYRIGGIFQECSSDLLEQKCFMLIGTQGMLG